MNPVSELLNRLGDVAREEVLKDFRPDSCVATTRILLDVLDHYGVRARAVGDSSTDGHTDTAVRAGADRIFTSLASTTNDICGVRTGHGVECWADIEVTRGFVGFTDHPYPLPGGAGLTMVSLGGWSSGCGLSAAGSASCWGLDLFGGWGNDHPYDAVPVPGGGTYKSITTGTGFGCGIGLDGVVSCWGSNQVGSLGIADVGISVTKPTPVATAGHFTQVLANGTRVCAVRDDSAVVCWGGYIMSGSLNKGIDWVPTVIPTALSPALSAFLHSVDMRPPTRSRNTLKGVSKRLWLPARP